jgi:hypothetical protein
MKTALITTTINVPKVLELYRAHSEDVRFFVAFDNKTPKAAYEYLYEFPNCEVLERCVDSYWNCSELIGWNTIARRNIAMLEALKWGADIIVTIDDDNIPVSWDYFGIFKYTIDTSWFGIQASSESGWFDVGTLLDPIAPHRGFPHVKASAPTYSHCPQRKVGVAAGICLGDPDISAVTRIAAHPTVHRVSELLRAGIIVDPAGERRIELTTSRSEHPEYPFTEMAYRGTNRGTWTVFNSQNTAIIRELAPAFFMIPQLGRYDDIFASLVLQRVMRERGYVVHFGPPFVWQQRNQHDLLKDLRAEQFGAERILDFAQWLDGFVFSGNERVTDQMKIMFTNLPDWMPERGKIQELVLAWCEDCDQAAPSGSEI